MHGGDIYKYPGMVDFSANINFLGPPEAVVDSARAALARIAHYPQVGCVRLCEAIAGLEQVQPEHVVCANGAAEAIFSLALAQKPKKAVLFAPTFGEYERALQSVGCEIQYARLRPEQGFCMTRDCFSKIESPVDMVIACNPNNPTGVLAGKETLQELLQICERMGALLVVDECFLDFVDSVDAYTMKCFLKGSQNLFILKAFTKTFAVPGLRLGYGLCSNAGVLGRMRQVTQPWNVSVPAQEAGIAAAQEPGFLERTRAALWEEKQFLLERLVIYQHWSRGSKGEPEDGFFLKIYGSSANFIFFQSVEGLGEAFREYGILIRDCSDFEGLGKGWYRIAVRGRADNKLLLDALDKIKKGYGSRQGVFDGILDRRKEHGKHIQ